MEDSKILELPVHERYKMIAKLSMGSYGEVWVADDQVLNQKVAVKKIHKWVTDQAGNLSSLRAEVTAGRSVVSQNVLKVYDVTKINRQDCLIMEYIDGVTLAELIREIGASAMERYRLAIDICRGLASIHSAGFTHRDLNPQNVLIEKTGRAIIVDLGLAGVAVKDAAPIRQTYRAPELMNLPSMILADIYSLGGLLAFIAGGDERKPLSSELWLLPIYSKCLSPQPADRYHSVDDLLSDIENARTESSASNLRRGRTIRNMRAAGGVALLAACSLFGFRQHSGAERDHSPRYVVVSSSDSVSQMFGDMIQNFLETEGASVSRPSGNRTPRELLERLPVDSAVVVFISQSNSKVVPGLSLTITRSASSSAREILIPGSRALPLEVLSKVATALGLPHPSSRFDYTADGYTTEDFSKFWRASKSRENSLEDPKSCSPAHSIPVQFLRARVYNRPSGLASDGSRRGCAVTAMSQLQALDGLTSQSVLLQAAILRSEGNDSDGVALIRSATTRLATKAPLFRSLSGSVLEKGFFPEALTLADQAIQIDPIDAEGYIASAKALLADGFDERALTRLREALAIDGRSSKAYSLCGAVLIRMGKFAAAKAAIASAIEIKATPESKVALGVASLLCGESAQAILILAGTAAESPTVLSYASLGAALRWIGETARSENALRMAARLGNPRSTDGLEIGRLAMVSVQLHKTDEADRLIATAAKLRSALDTEILYDALVVDAFAKRRQACVRKFVTLKARHFPVAFLMHDPQIAEILREAVPAADLM